MASDESTLNQVVVVDNGNGSIKAGLAGEAQAQVQFRSFVGRRKLDLTMKQANVRHGMVRGGARRTSKVTDTDELFPGDMGMDMRGILKFTYPQVNGVVDNWDDMLVLWSYMYSQQLRLQPEEHPLLISEPTFTSHSHRKLMTECLFEKLRVPAVCFVPAPVLSLYAARQTTGLVLDSGEGITQCVPIYEGYPVTSAITRVDVAGADVTSHLTTLLRKAGHTFHTTAERELVREIKEALCYVSSNPLAEEAAPRGDNLSSYLLPDGNQVTLGNERFRAGEVLFRPSLFGSEYMGAHELVVDSIGKTDMCMRQELYANVLLAGGTTKMLGYGERLVKELSRAAPTDTKVRIRAPPDRAQSAWLGGSILASMRSFRQMLTTRREYEDAGYNVIAQRLF